MNSFRISHSALYSIQVRRPGGPSRSQSAIRNLACLVLAVLALGCYKAAPPLSTVGTLVLSVDMLKKGLSNTINMAQPDLRAASCNIRVLVPDGPRSVMATNQGMIVEVSWEAIKPFEVDSKKGITRVEFINFKWSVLNPVNYGAGTKILAVPTLRKSLVLGNQKREALLPLMSMAAAGAPMWQQQASWSVIADWQGGLINQTQPINIVDRYKAAHPEKKTAPIPVKPGPRGGYGVRR